MVEVDRKGKPAWQLEGVGFLDLYIQFAETINILKDLRPSTGCLLCCLLVLNPSLFMREAQHLRWLDQPPPTTQNRQSMQLPIRKVTQRIKELCWDGIPLSLSLFLKHLHLPSSFF